MVIRVLCVCFCYCKLASLSADCKLHYCKLTSRGYAVDVFCYEFRLSASLSILHNNNTILRRIQNSNFHGNKFQDDIFVN